MKNLIVLISSLIFVAINSNAQSVDYRNITGRQIPAISFIRFSDNDTLQWFWNSAEVATAIANSSTAIHASYLFGSYHGTGNGTKDTFQITVPSGYNYALCTFKSGATVGTDSLASYGCILNGTTLTLNFYNKSGKTIPPLDTFNINYFLGK